MVKNIDTNHYMGYNNYVLLPLSDPLAPGFEYM